MPHNLCGFQEVIPVVIVYKMLPNTSASSDKFI